MKTAVKPPTRRSMLKYLERKNEKRRTCMAWPWKDSDSLINCFSSRSEKSRNMYQYHIGMLPAPARGRIQQTAKYDCGHYKVAAIQGQQWCAQSEMHVPAVDACTRWHLAALFALLKISFDVEGNQFCCCLKIFHFHFCQLLVSFSSFGYSLYKQSPLHL